MVSISPVVGVCDFSASLCRVVKMGKSSETISAINNGPSCYGDSLTQVSESPGVLNLRGVVVGLLSSFFLRVQFMSRVVNSQTPSSRLFMLLSGGISSHHSYAE